MEWLDIVSELISEMCRGSEAEFLRKTGFATGHLQTWRTNPNSKPQMKTIARVEEGLGVSIETDSTGKPTGWKKSQAARQGFPAQIGIVRDDLDTPRAEVRIPETAREFYERIEFHGGKVDWMEMEDEQRSFYENLHAMLVSAIDSANDRYAASLREIRAARDREIRAALEEFERTFRKRMLGILGN
jgi:hypothetical protein